MEMPINDLNYRLFYSSKLVSLGHFLLVVLGILKGKSTQECNYVSHVFCNQSFPDHSLSTPYEGASGISELKGDTAFLQFEQLYKAAFITFVSFGCKNGSGTLIFLSSSSEEIIYPQGLD